MDYENNYLLKASAVIIHYILSGQSEFQYICWSASQVFFFLLLSQFKFTQLKHTRKASHQNVWRIVQWAVFYLCTGMEKRSNSNQQNSCQGWTADCQ